ncbi:MAG: alkaline phosphatase family protein [Alistipes sp.]|nr:alkaline phosphatase family protein [Alistipes sp.]
MKILRYIASFVVILLFQTTAESFAQPRLVVNIVVSSMRADDLTRYEKNFSEGGFRRLIYGGATFYNASYDYMQTTTPVSLATLTTGAQPSTHGVVAEEWFEYITNNRISLINDDKERCVDFSSGTGNYSPRQLTAQTLSDALLEQHPESRIATIAVEPLSAIVTAGHSGEVYWMEKNKGYWTTSSYYTDKLPDWVKSYNQADISRAYVMNRWTAILPYDNYINSQVLHIEGLHSKRNKRIEFIDSTNGKPAKRVPITDIYKHIAMTPTGNSVMFSFAKQVIAQCEMGKDETPDMLNIVLDTPRNISEHFGPESVEYEDMIYRLDHELADFITYAIAQVASPEQVLITLSSDHGTSPSYNSPNKVKERFNTMQAEVITNAYIGSLHGNGQWVLGYIDRAIYLNHNLIREKELSLADLQHEVATFMMQLRGVSHAVSAHAMRSSYFGSGYGKKMQNGYYPRRSGDVIINLMPGWIEENGRKRSSSGSMYLYDRQVPLIIFGGGVKPAQNHDSVDLTSVTPTIAHILGITPPSAAEGEKLNIIKR